ncbi:MAG: spore germination protein GerA family [Eubacterium sp.]|nr:spore germination protein GerA family [Eubacterium sp.]
MCKTCTRIILHKLHTLYLKFLRACLSSACKNKNKQINVEEYVDKGKLTKSLNENVELFKDIFSDDDTLTIRHMENQQNTAVKCCILFIDGMIDVAVVNDNIIQPVVQNSMLKSHGDVLAHIQNQVLVTNSLQKTSEVQSLVKAILSGDTVLFAEGSAEALTISTKGVQSRAIEEPEAEKVVRGPREGFTEPLMTNLSLIRNKLVTPDLKFKFLTVGSKSGTKICICYLKSIANHKILNELYKRLDSIEIDGVMGSGSIAELIKDAAFSPLKTVGSTERPDVVAGKLLEGRIAILMDGTPVALTVPHIFVEYFQANEDYYINFYFSTISRLLRIIGFMLTVSVPAIYVALMTFHQEMIPTPLLISISAARQGVPFPTIVETLLLLIVFEILRETGTRMPTNIGQALSIVGALVLGQASVEAKIVSAPIVIVVAISGITSLIIPRIQGTALILRVIFLLLTSLLGFYGLIFGITGFLLHLCQIRSFGVPYMLYLTSLDPGDLKDTIVRAPLWYMNNRPKLIAVNNNKLRQGGGDKKT